MKPLSRQRRWQLARIASGRCPQCGRKAARGIIHCLACAVQSRERNRLAAGCTRRNNSRTYRLESKTKS